MTLFIVGVCARVSACLPACLDLCPCVTCSGSDCRSACNRFTSRFILCIHVFLWPCVSLCLCVFISLSLTERTSAGARDKSPEEVGSGWGEAGEKGGKKDRQDSGDAWEPGSRERKRELGGAVVGTSARAGDQYSI